MTRTANSFFVISCTHAHLNLVFGKTKGFGEGGKGYHVSCFPFETETSVTILDPGDPVTPLPYSSPTLPPENYREGVVEPPTVQHTVLFFSMRDNTLSPSVPPSLDQQGKDYKSPTFLLFTCENLKLS